MVRALAPFMLSMLSLRDQRPSLIDFGANIHIDVKAFLRPFPLRAARG
jgi:hypothetical protein